ncbi:HD domain-containing protein [Candidatus Gottesmanbacteria bacterium]|nr:HD domain-containing protein [Candidatus Gottesmanbacteria bacterium]
MLKDYHHFKGSTLSRSEKIQRLVTKMILESKIPDDKRENSVVWELKHHAGTVQIGRILAIKRGLDVEITEIICVLHDIYAIVTGKYANHARLGAEMAKDILIKSHSFPFDEIQTITEAIASHSDKQVYTEKPYVELAKDADVFECSLYAGAEGFYRLHKKDEIFREYVNRIKNVRKELGLSKEPIFRE